MSKIENAIEIIKNHDCYLELNRIVDEANHPESRLKIWITNDDTINLLFESHVPAHIVKNKYEFSDHLDLIGRSIGFIVDFNLIVRNTIPELFT